MRRCFQMKRNVLVFAAFATMALSGGSALAKDVEGFPKRSALTPASAKSRGAAALKKCAAWERVQGKPPKCVKNASKHKFDAGIFKPAARSRGTVKFKPFTLGELNAMAKKATKGARGKFKPFKLKDKVTGWKPGPSARGSKGKAIDWSTPKETTTEQYMAELNKLGKSMAARGFDLRGKSDNVTMGSVDSQDALLDKQRKDIEAEFSDITAMPVHRKPAYLDVKPKAGSRGAKNFQSRMLRDVPDFKVVEAHKGGKAKGKGSRGARGKTKLGQYDSKNEFKKFVTFGSKKIAAAEVGGGIHITANKDHLHFDALGGAWIYLFKKQMTILAAHARLDSNNKGPVTKPSCEKKKCNRSKPGKNACCEEFGATCDEHPKYNKKEHKGEVHAKLTLTVLGVERVIFDKKGHGVEIAKEWSKQAEWGFKTHFAAGPIPISIEVGAAFKVGFRYRLALMPTRLSASVGPYIQADAFVRLAIDIFIMAVGVEGRLTIVDAELKLHGEAGLDGDEHGLFLYSYFAGDLAIEALSGLVRLFFRVNLCLIGCSKTWWVKLFGFKGIQKQINLFRVDMPRIYLLGKAPPMTNDAHFVQLNRYFRPGHTSLKKAGLKKESLISKNQDDVLVWPTSDRQLGWAKKPAQELESAKGKTDPFAYQKADFWWEEKGFKKTIGAQKRSDVGYLFRTCNEALQYASLLAGRPLAELNDLAKTKKELTKEVHFYQGTKIFRKKGFSDWTASTSPGLYKNVTSKSKMIRKLTPWRLIKAAEKKPLCMFSENAPKLAHAKKFTKQLIPVWRWSRSAQDSHWATDSRPMKFGYGLVCYKGKKKGDVLIKNKKEIKAAIKNKECTQGYLVRGAKKTKKNITGYPKWPSKTIKPFKYDEKKLKAALAKQKVEKTMKGLVRYYHGKTRDVAESANGKLSKRFKRGRFKKVGAVGQVFARCSDAGAFLMLYNGKNFRFDEKSHTRRIYFRETRGPKGKEFFSSVDPRHKKYKKTAPDACLISTNAIKWKKPLWNQVTPVYRFHHPKTKDNQLVVSKGDHKSATKGGYCLMCWNEKRGGFAKKPICGTNRIWGAIGKDACAMGYIVRKR